MLRRRLRLSCSSDEESPEPRRQQQQQQHGNGVQNRHQSSPPNPTPNPSDLLEISDEEFIDVSDNLSTPSPPSPTPPPSSAVPPSSGGDSFAGSACPISDCLGRLGLRLRRQWLDSCNSGLQSSVPGFRSLDASGKAKLCFEQFLFSDMNYSGGGILPENVDSMHLVDLAGPFVLQVDEIVNISAPLRGRYQKASCGIKRCLKLSMTDGVQRVFGMEYRPIKALEVFAPAGLKVVICNVHIRHGLMMLVPEAFEVLGGLVDELEAARQRLVEEVNKPPRGKRTRSGEVPSLAMRATLAAWPTNGSSVLGHNNSSTSQDVNSSEGNVRGVSSVTFGVETSRRTTEEFNGHSTGASAVRNPSSNNILDVEEIYMDAVGVDNEDITPNPPSNSIRNPSPNNVLDVDEIHMDTVPVNNEDVIPNIPPSAVSDVQIVDQVEHLRILSGERETPFTYLASLSGRWAAIKENATYVQGKIKCFLTGVKRFQYKQRRTYELQVYVDDGSLISEIFIDHNVVEKVIGHSPEEVTAALSSPDTKIVANMKDTLKQFQIFLVNFEGTMHVEINGTSLLPIAREMNQGCPSSDAWLLLRRLKSLAPVQTPRNIHFDPIDISP